MHRKTAKWEVERTLASLKSRGEGIYIDPSVRLYGPEYIAIGAGTRIELDSRLQAIDWYPPSGQRFQPEIIIGERCFIEFFVHIGACYRVEIGNDVTIASGCYISDHQHRYDDPLTPISLQPLTEEGHVIIGDDSFIGERACVFSNVTIGRHVVVGANSVVTKNIPSYCVAAGVPARVLRHYSFEQKAWVAGAPVASALEADTNLAT